MDLTEMVETIDSQSPISVEENAKLQELSYLLSIIVPIIYASIVFIGLVGNSLVVVVVICDLQMRSTTNILIFNLAIADLLFIIFCVPFTAVDYAMEHWPFGDLWCKIVQYLIFISAYASIYTLVMMSLDRFLAVVHPVPSMSIRTEKNAYRAIFFLWIAIIVFCVPILFIHRTESETGDESASMCSAGQEYAPMFWITFFLSSYAIPLSLTFILYIFMLKRLWHSDIRTERSSRCKRKVSRMVIVVVVTFAICWGPVEIIQVLKSHKIIETTSATQISLLICSQILAYTNSCLNPILYAFLSDNFRKAFIKVISCGQRNSGYNSAHLHGTNNHPTHGLPSNMTATSTMGHNHHHGVAGMGHGGGLLIGRHDIRPTTLELQTETTSEFSV
ncbi:allatostatin-A receptor-like isoform X2 [Brevipalpus obovatus]|uniref:allatostatin-A receptor-like isoform X2 n=1 Tax=Brevipalpus obovatus TaxID=246614 RepID=UPI003D9F3B08